MHKEGADNWAQQDNETQAKHIKVITGGDPEPSK